MRKRVRLWGMTVVETISPQSRLAQTNIAGTAASVSRISPSRKQNRKIPPREEPSAIRSPSSARRRLIRNQKVPMMARKAGAQWIVVHGETVTEPVAPGTNRASVESSEVDVLAHPGFITLEEAQIAKDNGVLLEVSGRAGHNITNGHVVNMARAVGAAMVVDSDTHAPENLMDDAAARTVAFGAGMTKEEAEKALYVTPYEAVRHIA